MAKVGIIQSNYLPWKGYFDIIHDVDLFIFYDDVQFTKNDWRNRNQIKTPKGKEWISIPCGRDLNRLIHEVAPSNRSWQAKHWALLEKNYGSAPHFARYAPFFKDFYLGQDWPNLSELNQHLVREISREFLGITTRFEDSRAYRLPGQRLERLMELLRLVEADLYVSGPSARDYVDERLFEKAGITLIYKDYAGYPEYPQAYPPFAHDVSIVDLLFNVGPAAPDYIWGWRTPR